MVQSCSIQDYPDNLGQQEERNIKYWIILMTKIDQKGSRAYSVINRDNWNKLLGYIPCMA